MVDDYFDWMMDPGNPSVSIISRAVCMQSAAVSSCGRAAEEGHRGIRESRKADRVEANESHMLCSEQ